MEKGRAHFWAVLVGPLLALYAPAASALEWTLQPATSMSQSISDNPALSLDTRQNLWGSTLDIYAKLDAASPSVRTSISPAVSLTRYQGHSDYERKNKALTLAVKVVREQQVLSMTTSYSEDETGSSEFDSTGLITPGAMVTRMSGVANWEYHLSEKLHLGSTIRYETDAYSRKTIQLFDSHTSSWTGYADYAFSEASTLQAAIRLRAFDVVAASDANDLQISAGLTHGYSATTSGNARVAIDTTEPSAKDTARRKSVLLSAGVQHRYQYATVDAAFDRSLDPSGAGTMLTKNQIHLSAARRVGPSLSISGSASAGRSEALYGARNIDRDYARLDVRAARQLSAYWSLGITYSRSWQKFHDLGAGSTENKSSLTLSYSPKTINLRRVTAR